MTVVIGASFYNHGDVRGRVLWRSPHASPTSPSELRQDLHPQDRTAGELHMYDPEKIVPQRFATPGIISRRGPKPIVGRNSIARRRRSPYSAVEKLIDVSAEGHCRSRSASPSPWRLQYRLRTTNDFSHVTERRGIAVLRLWSMSTLGDPMREFPYLLMQWSMPGLGSADLQSAATSPMERRRRSNCLTPARRYRALTWYFTAYKLFRLARSRKVPPGAS